MVQRPVFHAFLSTVVQHVVPEDMVSQSLIIDVAIRIEEMAVEAPVSWLSLGENGLVLARVGKNVILNALQFLLIDSEH